MIARLSCRNIEEQWLGLEHTIEILDLGIS